MAPPWTAEEAASDAVSKKMLIEYMQTNCDQAFLTAERLQGQPASVQKRVTKADMVDAYKKTLGSEPAPLPPPGAGAALPKPPKGSSTPPASSAFTFSAPNSGGSPSPFGAPNPFGGSPAQPAPASSFQFNFGGKADGEEAISTETMGKGGKGGDDDDDDDDDYDDDEDMSLALQKRLQRLNMSASQRRDATMGELTPVRA